MSPELRSESPTHESSEHSTATTANPGLPSSIVEIPQKYESVMQKYAKVPSTSVLPLPTLVYVEACLKVGRFLLTVAMNGGWNDKVVALLVQGKLTSEITENEQENDHMVMDPKMLKDSGVTRLSIAEWTMRAAGNHMQDIPVMDQVKMQ
jgi:trafficking protein particle complex subunit 9